MEIRNINKNDLDLLCVDVITQALADLGQKDNDPEHKVMLAQSLAKDLQKRYAFFPMEAVKIAFDNGIRDTQLFVLSAANWCKWLNKMKTEIWEGWYNFECGNNHVIQPHIKNIMRKQSTLLVEYNKKRLIN